MNTLTVFEAYRRTREQMEMYRGYRGSARGIAVCSDRWARRWQHRDRQAKRFYRWLHNRIEALEEASGHNTKEVWEL